VSRLGIRHVVVHGSLYAQFLPRCLPKAEAMLRAHGFRRVAAGGALALWSQRP
jgi:hypothetical protein